MTVREDETLRFDGHKGIFGVVEKPDFSLIIPYSNGGFHLVEQYRYPVRERYWEFPQGSWEGQPDADPVALAAGELQEETGLRAGSLVWLGHLFGSYGYCDQGFNVLLATHLLLGEARLAEEEMGGEPLVFRRGGLATDRGGAVQRRSFDSGPRPVRTAPWS
jgi:ADP-ribose pyrophosphatase